MFINRGMILNPPIDTTGGGNDSFTKILLHMDGTDGSTTFTDSASGGASHTWTRAGNGQLDTAIVKFGSAAGLFDGTGDSVSTPDHADFTLGSGAWTVDFWFNPASGGAGTTRRAFAQSDSLNNLSTQTVAGGMSSTNTINGYAVISTTSYLLLGSTAISSPGWHHYAFIRTGDILRLFLDGVQEGSDLAITGSINDSTQVWAVGQRGANTASPWFGSIDEFRLSVGIARWTSNFIPPVGPYY